MFNTIVISNLTVQTAVSAKTNKPYKYVEYNGSRYFVPVTITKPKVDMFINLDLKDKTFSIFFN